jgi:hypothetical protein
MSRRDLAHVMTALWRLSGQRPDIAVRVADIDEAIGRGRNDMRTPLNLQSLRDDQLVVARPDDAWALTPQGVDWIVEDPEGAWARLLRWGHGGIEPDAARSERAAPS